jgi:uncharacterized membrane protein
MTEFLNYLSFGTGLTGIVVIVWGTLLTAVEFITLEVQQLRGKNICPRRELMRHHYGSYILLGLEFLIAADIIHTLIQPSLEELAALGAIVAIRTVLSHFLNREMETHSCENR